MQFSQRNYFDNSIWLKLSSCGSGPFELHPPCKSTDWLDLFWFCLTNHSKSTQCQIPDLRSFYGNQRMPKWPKIVYLLPIVSFGCNPTEAFKSHPENWEAYFIKWTTSVEPTVGSKSPQDSKWGHSWAIDYFILLSWPCMIWFNKQFVS